MRAFKKVVENIIEIMNETYFLLMVTGLLFFNTEKQWNVMAKEIYLGLIISNSVMILVLMLSK